MVKNEWVPLKTIEEYVHSHSNAYIQRLVIVCVHFMHAYINTLTDLEQPKVAARLAGLRVLADLFICLVISWVCMVKTRRKGENV